MTQSKRKVTIYEIAKEAGVAPGTASRALNNRGYMKAETKQKVEQAAKKLKYTPNRAARILKTKKTGLILLAIPDMDNTFYVDMIKAVQEVLIHNQYSLVLYYTGGKRDGELKAIHMMHEHFADGMLLVNFYYDEEYKAELDRIEYPVVLSGISLGTMEEENQGNFDYVGVDTAKGMFLAANHLIQQGHVRIGYVGGRKSLYVFKERLSGYKKALVRGALPIKHELICFSDYTEQSGYDAAKYFMNLSKPPTAICTANDLMALGAIQYLEEKNINIPEDIAVVGMDNIDVDVRVKPKLTSVAIANWEIGRTAAELIINRIKDKETGGAKRIIFEPRLVARESSIQKRQNK